MAGMHRDKCGAAAVAGFFQVNDPTTWMINIDSCMYLFPTEPYSCSLDFSQVEAKTSEGYRLHGHGEEQRWCRSVWSTFFFFLHHTCYCLHFSLRDLCDSSFSQMTVCVFCQTAMWLMNWWFPVPVAEWGWETQTLRDVWWWSTCSVRWRRRCCD